jgi:DNA-binding MarR family transcriptional regulator
LFDLDLAARILSSCSESTLTVSDLIRKVRGNHDKTMALIKQLEKRSLLLPEISRNYGMGRPRKYMRLTPIGRQFIAECNLLYDLSVRSNDNDIKKALHQAELAQKLVESGISPYARFQEINEIARNIARTAEIEHRTR